MAVALERFVPSVRNYPWDLWTNGRGYRAEAGVDFKCTIKGFRSALLMHAKRAVDRGEPPMEVETKVVSNRYVEFQFTKKPKPKKPAAKSRRKARS